MLGVAAYSFWGVLPIYFKLLAAIGPVELVAHRIVWSLPILALLVTLTAGWPTVRAAMRTHKTLLLLAVTAMLIGVNWLLYVYAVNNGHILAGSLGYYLNPLANVLLGRIVLKEKLARLQWAAVVIAAAGIAALAVGALGQLWISLILCFSFATYGLLRKIAPVEAVAGLTVETILLFPLAAGWLIWSYVSAVPIFGQSSGDVALLSVSGLVTMVPLLLFTAAARRLRYSTLGMLQFLAPTMQFILAVMIYGEPFTRAHAIAFGAIWIAIILYVISVVRHARSSVTLPE